MGRVNIPLDKLTVRRDFNAHVALEFYRGEKWSEFLAFDPCGLQKYREHTKHFESRFDRKINTPIERAALAFAGSLRSAYLPGDGVADILMEIMIMAATNNTDLVALDTKQLIEVHNKLASAVGKPALKSFKESKTKLIARIEALKAAAGKPTPEQAANKVAATAKAEKRLESLKNLQAAKAAKAKQSAPNNAKPKMTTKEVSKKGADALKAKSLGIGSFCMGLIKEGKTNAEVLAAAQKQFPTAKTSASSVAWYRNKLKSDGEIAA